MNIKMIAMGLVFVLAVMGASVGSSVYVAMYIAGQAQPVAEDAAPEMEPEAPPVYIRMEPFIVNFVQEEALRYLQLTIQLMTRDAEIETDIAAYRPEIRNALILLLSGHSYRELITREGKEAIREEIRLEVNNILKKEEGVESVYLTGFVMQ